MNRERAPRASLARSGWVMEQEWRVAVWSFERVRVRRRVERAPCVVVEAQRITRSTRALLT